MTAWYVYILSTVQCTFYTGITNNPTRRIRQHSGIIKGGAKALRGKGPLKYECVFEVSDKSEALKLEAWIKRHSRTQKQEIIRYTRIPEITATPLPADIILQMNSEHRSQ